MRRLVSRLLIQHTLIATSLGLLAAGTAGAAANPAMDPNNLIVQVGEGETPEKLGEVLDQLGNRPIYLVKPNKPAASVLSGPSPERPNFVEPNSVVRSPEHDPARAIYNSVSAIEIAGPSGPASGPDWTEKALDMGKYPKIALASEPVGVGVLDTGADTAHVHLGRYLVKGHDFVDSIRGDDDASEGSPPAPNPFTISDGKDWAYGHGTHVSGVIAKLAPSAKIAPVRVLDNRGVGTVWTVLKGIVWAIDPVKGPAGGAAVLNLSLGTHEKSEALLRVIQIAVCDQKLLTPAPPFKHSGFDSDRTRCATKAGAFVFAGAGNNPAKPLFPAAFQGLERLKSVTATVGKGGPASYANQDSSVDIAAPGDQIKSTFPPSQYATLSGTSMATPWLAGTAAQLLASEPRTGTFWKSDTQMWDRILKTSVQSCGSRFREVSPLAAITGDSFNRPCR